MLLWLRSLPGLHIPAHALRPLRHRSPPLQAYDAKLGELQRERDALDRERSDLLRKLEELKHASGAVAGWRGLAGWLAAATAAVAVLAAAVWW